MIVNMQSISDPRGTLVVAEHGKHFPFSVERCYFIFDTPAEQPRGFHAHKKTEQFLICARGSCELIVDDGTNRTSVQMNDPRQGIYMPPMVWHEMYHFSADCLFLVYASALYDENDYIRDYAEFKTLCTAT